jgi:hypothetical protein
MRSIQKSLHLGALPEAISPTKRGIAGYNTCQYWPFRAVRSFRVLSGPNAHRVTPVIYTRYAVGARTKYLIPVTVHVASGRIAFRSGACTIHTDTRCSWICGNHRCRGEEREDGYSTQAADGPARG